MKIAIVGAGFCGLATTWNFLHQFSDLPNLELTVFDSNEIGEGTSGMAAGLLHPYAGAHAKLNWRGIEGFKASCELISIAEEKLQSPVTAHGKGILRLAATIKQQNDYLKSPALLDSNISWLDEKACQEMVPNCLKCPALWIKQGLTVYCAEYLRGLWIACEEKGAQFYKSSINSLNNLKDFSIIIITAGALCHTIKELSHLPLKTVKGQMLELSWPRHIPRLPCALNSHAYIVMKPSTESCLVGSSYERNFKNTSVDLESAIAEIMPKAEHILPSLAQAEIIQGYTGLRSVTLNHLPFCEKLHTNVNTWILSGMGSKGLLYHALMAKELVTTIRNSISKKFF